MAGERLEKIVTALKVVKGRRIEFAEALGQTQLPKDEPERLIEELLKAHEAVKVLQEIMAEEERKQ
jgi:hypothetical protein